MRKICFIVVSFVFFVLSVPGSSIGEDIILGKGNFYNPPGKTSRLMAKGDIMDIIANGLENVTYEWELYFQFVGSDENEYFQNPIVLETTGKGKFASDDITLSSWTIKNPNEDDAGSISGDLNAFPSILYLTPSGEELFPRLFPGVYETYQGELTIYLNHAEFGELTLEISCLKAQRETDTDALVEFTIVTPDEGCGSDPYGTLWGDENVDWSLSDEAVDDETTDDSTPDEVEDTASGTVIVPGKSTSGDVDDSGSCFISDLR